METAKDGVPLSAPDDLCQWCMALLDFSIVVSFGGEFCMYACLNAQLVPLVHIYLAHHCSEEFGRVVICSCPSAHSRSSIWSHQDYLFMKHAKVQLTSFIWFVYFS